MADFIFHNGRVITVDGSDSIQQAIAVNENIIQAVGLDKDILSLAGAGAKVIDLRGRTLIPGIIDTHAHMDREGLKSLFPSLSGVASISDILEVVKREVASKVPGEWVVTMPIGDPPNFSEVPERLVEGRYPTRWELDQVSPDNPVYIRGIWTPWNVPPSVAVANSCALKLAGIDRSTPNPDESVSIEHDSSGEPTGVIIDSNRFPTVEFNLMRVVPRFTHSQRVDALKESMRLYNSVGTTGVYEGHGIAPEVMKVYKEAWDMGEMTVRSHLVLSPTWKSIEGAEYDMARWSYTASGVGFGDDMLRFGGYFIQSGGVPYVAETRSAELPYTGWAGFAENHHPWSHFEQLVRMAAGHNLRLNVLVSQDQDRALDLFEEIHKDTPIDPRRWVWVHARQLDRGQVVRLKNLGFLLETLPLTELWLRGNRYLDDLPLAEIADSHRTYLEEGTRFALGTDNKPYNPFATLWAAVARKERRTGTVLGPGQKLSRLEALRAFTHYGAYFTFDEDRRGSLEPGKLADLAVLSDDFLNMPEDDIPGLRSLLTMVDGKIVHQGEGF